MPLAEGQAFNNALFKTYATLVRDIKMGVAVVSRQTAVLLPDPYLTKRACHECCSRRHAPTTVPLNLWDSAD